MAKLMPPSVEAVGEQWACDVHTDPRLTVSAQKAGTSFACLAPANLSRALL